MPSHTICTASSPPLLNIHRVKSLHVFVADSFSFDSCIYESNQHVGFDHYWPDQKWSLVQLTPVTSPFPTCLAIKEYHKDITNIKYTMTQLSGHSFGHICPHEGAKFQKTHARQKHPPPHIKEVVLEMLVLEMVEQLGLLLSHVYQVQK